MDLAKEFSKIMKKDMRIALASSVDGIPNVRIVNFVYLPNEKALFFASDKTDPKSKEFRANSNVALTTIPSRGLAHIRVHRASVKQSQKSVFDMKDIFTAKMPWYEEIIKQNGENMILWEVRFSNAKVLLGPDKAGEIEI